MPDYLCADRFTRLIHGGGVLVAVVLVLVAPASPQAADLTAREVTQAFFKATRAAPADFAGRKLIELDLSGLDFKRARLTGADLYGADLSSADLTGVALQGARLDRATLIKANFAGADLSSATILRPTLFSGLESDPKDAPSFRGANLTRTRILSTRLDGADFSSADLTDAVLGRIDYAWGEARHAQRAVMQGCNFEDSKLVRTDLSNGVFYFARFRRADLSGANLTGADLSKADLSGADLTGANLTDANLDEAILAGVRGLDTVRGLHSVRNLDRSVR